MYRKQTCHNRQACLRMLGYTTESAGEGYHLPKTESVSYTVEREFLSKISVEELLLRLIESHIQNDYR